MNRKVFFFGLALLFYSETHVAIYRYCFNQKNTIFIKTIKQLNKNGKLIFTATETIEPKQHSSAGVCDAINEPNRLNLLVDDVLRIVSLLIIIVGFLGEKKLWSFLKKSISLVSSFAKIKK